MVSLMSNISPRHESQSRHHHRHFRTITVVDSSWLLLKRSARLVVDVLYFSGVSVALAALSTFVISRGDFFLPSSCQRSHASFLQILQVITCVSHAFAVVGVKVVEMRALHQADHPEQRLSALWSLVQLSCHGAPCAFVVALGAIVGATYGVERLSVHKPRINALKLHFYLSCLINAGFRVAVSVAERRIYQQTTLEGRAQQQHHCSSNSSSPPSPPCFVLFLRAYVRVLVPLAIMFLAAGVVHASTYIHLKSHQDTLLFSFAAQALKMAVLALTKRLVLRKSNMSMDESGSAKVVYGITAMPAILIHTQARLILLHTQLSLSVYGIVVFSVLEPALRIARVEWARREVRERLKRNQIVSDSELRRVLPRIAFRSGMLVVSRDRRETPVTFMAEQVDAFLCWKRSLLRFHAAELCAVSAQTGVNLCFSC